MIKRDFGLVAGTIIAASTATNVAGQPVSYDFNNDGSSDYPVSVVGYDASTPAVGAARVWSGASKSIIHTIESAGTNTLFGWSTGSAGDLNGDGFDDLIVGEPLWSASTNYEGRIQVFSGADASVLLTITGGYVDTGLGRYVAGIGDWDGDGTGDIAASGWDIADTDGDGIGDDAIGMVYIYSGVNGALLTEIAEPTATATFGYSVFGLGDITGDGKADIAISDPHAELIPGSGTPGQLYIFEGSATAGSYDLTDAYRTISNSDSGTRVFAAQVDVMHPDLWLDEPTLQVISMTLPGNGGANQAPISIDILKADGTVSGTKGTRSSLQLAGDINLDGKVDAADLQESISQLGTDPQAIGVMPIADSNKDGIIDMLDVQVVMDGYGGATDIYEGLWDGSRLLSIAAGASGFGSTASLSGGGLGGTQWGGGRRPIDGCNRSMTPPDAPGSLVPSLLRFDAEDSCSECPEYDDNPTCYTCDEPKSVSGGSVSADPEQPDIFDTVIFTVSGVSETPGQLICIESCGDDGATEPTPLGDPVYIWEVLTKGENGWPAEHDPNIDPHAGWQTGDSIQVTGTACDVIKAICWARPSLPCLPDPVWARIGEKEVDFEEFTLDVVNEASTPADNKRTTVGVCEVTEINVVEGLQVNWEIVSGEGVITSTYGASICFIAPTEASTVTIKATGPNCDEEIVFTVIEPSGVLMNKIGEQHVNGMANSGFCANPVILPTSVSFTGLQIREGVVAGVGTGSFSGGNGQVHPLGDWFPIGENNTNPFAVDNIRSFADAPNPNPNGYTFGFFLWAIPWEYKCGGTEKQFTVVNHFEQIYTDGTITMSKGGASSTHAVSDPGETCQ